MLNKVRTAVLPAVAVGVATVVSTVVLSAAPASAATPPAIDPCDLSKTVNELNKDGSAKPQNVMVYAESADAYSHFEGITKEGSRQAYGCGVVVGSKKTFHWVVFTGSGEFVRKGDGGYRNWAFSGYFTRSDDVHVVFHAVG